MLILGMGGITALFGKMYRIIAHILQKTGFLTAFIELSNICARWVTVYSCVRPRKNPFELAIPLVTLLLALQYGAFLRGEITILKMKWRWFIGAIFFGALFFVASPTLIHSVNLDIVDHAFSWPVSWDYVIQAVGKFYPYVTLYWMPFAGLISLGAFVASFAPSYTNEESSE